MLLNNLRALHDQLNLLNKDLEYLDTFWNNHIHPYYIEQNLSEVVYRKIFLGINEEVSPRILQDPFFRSLAMNLRMFAIGLVREQKKAKEKMEAILEQIGIEE